MKKELVAFWIGALAVTLGLSAALFRYAAVSPEVLARSRTPQPMESMPDVNLGNPYGTVSVTDLVGYYIDHPPAPKGAAQADDGGGHHFRGC